MVIIVIMYWDKIEGRENFYVYVFMVRENLYILICKING